MQLSYKIGKVVSGDAYVSARRHVRQWLIGRAPLRFDAAKITATIDREKFKELSDRYGVENPGDEWPKYPEQKDLPLAQFAEEIRRQEVAFTSQPLVQFLSKD